MPLVRVCRRLLCVLMISAGVAAAQPADPYAGRVADSEPLTAEEQRQRFHLPPGFQIQLVAAEPEIRKPINLGFDHRGRLYATQSVEYPFPAEAGAKTGDAVRVLSDFGPDGRARRVATFLDGLNIPIGVAPLEAGALVYSIPNLYWCPDEDHDGRADRRDVVLGEFGFRDTHGMVNGLTPWIDGWVYACHGFSNASTVQDRQGHELTMQSGNTFRVRPDGSNLEQITHGQVNPFGLSFDPLGNLYSADCHTLPAYMLLRGAYYPSFGKPHDGLGFGPTLMSHQHGSTAISGIAYYAADHFPPEYRDTLFIGNPVTACVNHDRLEPHGSTYRAIEQPDFLSCDDPWFRPVDIELGPDGALYIADFYNRIIGHYEVPLTHPGRDRERGRIWRIVYVGADGRHPPPVLPDLSTATPDQLIARLSDPTLAVRVQATNLLAALPAGNNSIAKLRSLVADKDSAAAVAAHGLWILERHGSLDDQRVRGLVDHPDHLVRVHLIKALAERADWSRGSLPLGELARKRLSDRDPFVRRAAAEALGLHPEIGNVSSLISLWSSTPEDDTHLVHVARIALRNYLQLPDAYDAVRSLAAADSTAADRLADVSLGVASADAAVFLLEHLISKPQDVTAARKYLQHVSQHLPAQRRAALYELAKRYQSGAPQVQLAVLRALHRGEQARSGTLPEQSREWGLHLIQELLAGDNDARIREAVELARELRLPELQAEIAALLKSRSRPTALRSLAVDAYVSSEAPGMALTLGQLLTDATEPIGLRQKAAAALGTTNSDAAREQLLAALKAAPERLAVEIGAALAANPAGAEALLTAVAQGAASPRLLKELNVDRRLRLTNLPDLDRRLSELTAGLSPLDDRVQRLISDRRGGYTQAKTDAEGGHKTYLKHCAACHRLAGEGNKIGPELDGIGNRGLDRLLEDLLDPSRNVDQAFRSTQIATADGRVLLGLALRQEGDVQVLADAQGKELRIPQSEIAEQSVSPLSPMPSNVPDLISEPEFYNLLGFLLSQRQAATSIPANGDARAGK